MTLVNKDQLDILATLRESVNEDKVELEAEVERLRGQIKELADKNKMQLEQINGLLLEKVNLQSEGLDQRDRMLQRERAIGDLRASMSGKDLPEDIKQRMLALHEENISLKEQYKTAQEKLVKAKAVRRCGGLLPCVVATDVRAQFIKQQDKLFKEEHAKSAGGVPSVRVLSCKSAAHADAHIVPGCLRGGGEQLPLADQDPGRGRRATEGASRPPSPIRCRLHVDVRGCLGRRRTGTGASRRSRSASSTI